MKKHINKILIGFIAFFISVNAYALIALAFAPVASLPSAISIAARGAAIIDKGKAFAWAGVESGKVATALKAGGIFAAASGGSVLVMEGSKVAGSLEYPTSPYVMDTWTHTAYGYTYQWVFEPSAGDPSYGHCLTYILDLSQVCMGELVPIGGSNGSCNDPWFPRNYWAACAPEAQGSEPTFDFANPTEKQIPLLNDANGDYYLDDQNNRVPVNPISFDEASQSYQSETGTSYDFLSNYWDSILNKPSDYQGLNVQQATDRANYLSGSNDPQYLENNDTLPVAPDYQPTNIEKVDGNSTLAIVNHYDENGNYSHTTTDTYRGYATYENGVLISTGSSYLGRTTTVDQSLVGTTSTANSSSLSTSSTYTGSDALTNSKVSENTVTENATSDAETDLLKQILQKTGATAINTKSLYDEVTTVPPVIIPPDPVAAFIDSVPDTATTKTDIQNAFDLNTQAFDFDQHTVTADFFNNQLCYNFIPSLEFWGNVYTNETISLKACEILDFLGIILLVIASYTAFQILLSGVARVQ